LPATDGPVLEDRDVRIAAAIGWPLQEGAESLIRVPVLMRAKSATGIIDNLREPDGFCHQLARALWAWWAEKRPVDEGARWLFDVSLFSTLVGPSGPDPLPLVELTDVRLPFTAIQLAPGEGL
jgi:hypothetical protein